MSTSKRDYVAVAAGLRKQWDAAHDEALRSDLVTDRVFIIEDIAKELAAHFEEGNPRFDRQRFLAAAIDQPGITNAWDEEAS